MKTKAHFVMRIVALVVVLVAVLITSVLLISFIIFSIRASGRLFLLGFGFRGLLTFFLLFPWFMLLLEILLLVVLEKLLKHFKFGYRSPLLYLGLIVLLAIVILGYLINFTPLHDALLFKAERKQLPIVGGFYEKLRIVPRERGTFRGVVDSIKDNTFTLKNDDYDIDHDEGLLTVVAPLNVNISKLLNVGDRVYVAGDLVNNEIHAYGLRKLSPNDY